MQLAASFDTFACAVKQQLSLKDPDRASFNRDHEQLATATGGPLGMRIAEVGASTEFVGLQCYRQLAVHRGMLAEIAAVDSVNGETDLDVVSLRLPEVLDSDCPDAPGSAVRPVLERYSLWTRRAMTELRELASSDWGVEVNRD
jgi:hypothetical protein